MNIVDVDLNFEREALLRPFKFKGGAFTEKWVNVTAMRSCSGHERTGIGSTAVLWSDPAFFAEHSEAGGNLLMSAVTEHACRLLRETDFETPASAVQSILPALHDYAKSVTGRSDLRRTFTLNSLVAPDNTLWKLYAAEQDCENFGDLLARDYPGFFRDRQETLACIPLITYNVPVEEMGAYVDNGVFLLKVKIGQSGSQREMLEKDCARLSEIHGALAGRETSFTESGRPALYLDANGRYETRELLMRLLDHCDAIGMLENIIVVEEPFPEELEEDLAGLPVRFAADESLHGVADVIKRLEMGYGAMTLKPAGKTMSMSLLMGKAALERGVPCFVADSACVPQLVEWNKNLAARLPAFPGLKCGFMESNGSSFYARWDWLLKDHPGYGRRWLEPRDGLFTLDDSFYQSSGCIFAEPGHYKQLAHCAKK